MSTGAVNACTARGIGRSRDKPSDEAICLPFPPCRRIPAPCADPLRCRCDRPHFACLCCAAKTDRASGRGISDTGVAILHNPRMPSITELEMRPCSPQTIEYEYVSNILWASLHGL